jgi:DNA polymerase-1
MLINIDVSGLEVVCAAYLSQDPVLINELVNGKDIHTDNQQKFGLPNRLIAKILKFRILYGGSEYSFARDPDFTSVSSSKDYWAKAIEAYYDKYKGIKKWHTSLLQQVTLTRKIVSPTGRFFTFEPKQGRNGIEWPTTTIKNYPVQSLGADLVMIARISLFNRMKQAGVKAKLVSSVHDSIVIDAPDDEVDLCAQMGNESIQAVPMNFKRLFGKEFNLPLKAEVLTGNNLGDMKTWQ